MGVLRSFSAGPLLRISQWRGQKGFIKLGHEQGKVVE